MRTFKIDIINMTKETKGYMKMKLLEILNNVYKYIYIYINI